MEKGPVVFLTLWLAGFLLYIPAAKAGWVIDATGWLYELTHETFAGYINRIHSETQSQYQLTQFITWVFYKLWGANPLLWSLLYITLHAVNGYLMYVICKKVFEDSGIRYSAVVAISGALLFVVCPYMSEVVIWKACYHYLQGFLFILLGLYWVQRYQHGQNKKYAVYAGCLFFLSTFSLEVFYVTPLLLLWLAMYYRVALRYDKRVFRHTVLHFVVPQLLMLCLYFILFYARYKNFRPHNHSIKADELMLYMAKPLKYIFHILFLGRFYPVHIKDKIYAICESAKTMILFYGIIGATAVYFIRNYKRQVIQVKMLLLFSGCICLLFGLIMPLAFPASALLVFFDRYCYLPAGFLFMFVAMLLFWKCGRNMAIVILVLLGGANIYFTIQMNTCWKQSAYINNRLLRELPPLGTSRVLLLNLPENLNGAPMIGSDPNGQFKVMRDLLVDSSVKNTIYDVMSYNLTTMHDGAHINVVNDSVVDVTLNQWGTWWWYTGHGGVSYENKEYRVNMKDAGHWYELTLKHPADDIMLLYEVDGQWKKVDRDKKGVVQD